VSDPFNPPHPGPEPPEPGPKPTAQLLGDDPATKAWAARAAAYDKWLDDYRRFLLAMSRGILMDDSRGSDHPAAIRHAIIVLSTVELERWKTPTDRLREAAMFRELGSRMKSLVAAGERDGG
jgi:hypothetical protein